MNCSASHRQVQMGILARDPAALKPSDFQPAYDRRCMKRELLLLTKAVALSTAN